MPHSIEVDDEVFAALQERAEPLVDAPNDVLRRVFGLEGDGKDRSPFVDRSAPSSRMPAARRASNQRTRDGKAPPLQLDAGGSVTRKRSRRGAGELLPLEQYCGPILRALAEAGGELRSREIRDRVAPYLEDLLYDGDRELGSEGEPAWHARIGWAGTLCRKDGHLDTDAPRGIWRLTAAGRKEAGRTEGI